MRLLLPALLLLLAPVVVQAQCPGMTVQQTSFATEPLTIGDTATSLTASIYKPPGIVPTMAVVSIEGGPIRFATTGTPTAEVGHPLPGPVSTFIICGLDSLSAFKAIRSADTDAALFATYYRNKP